MSEVKERVPAKDEVWRHYNGILYVVEALANEYTTRDEYPATVVYRGPNRRVWSRPLSDWHRSMTYVARLEAKDEPTIQLNPADQLPPVACPLLIDVEGSLVKAERTEFVQHRGQDMVYRLVDGSTLLGRFQWTYP